MKGQTAGILASVLVLAIIVSGFIPYIVALRVVETPYSTTRTSTISFVGPHVSQVASLTASTTVRTEQSITTTSRQVYQIAPRSINCSNWIYQSASFGQGYNVQVAISTSDVVDAYIFNSLQYLAYHGGTTDNNQASLAGQKNGTFGFNVAVPGTYYLVIYNPHSLFVCTGGTNVAVYSAVGTATYQQAVTYYVTETNTGVTYSTTTETITLYSNSQYTTTLTSTTTKTCTLGWIQAIIGCG